MPSIGQTFKGEDEGGVEMCDGWRPWDASGREVVKVRLLCCAMRRAREVARKVVVEEDMVDR